MTATAPRRGFSLMEVLLATAILLGSVLVLMELAGIGRHYIQSVDRRTTAQLLCQTKMSELLAGIQRVEPVEQRVFEDQPDWNYTIEVTPVSGTDLVSLKVTVMENVVEGESRVVRGKPKSFSLVRWVRRPRGATFSSSPELEQAGELP